MPTNKLDFYDETIATISFWSAVSIEIAVLLIIGVLTALRMPYNHQIIFTYGIAPIIFLGLIYNFLFYPRWAKTNPMLANYFCIFFIQLIFLVFIYTQGGLDTNYFMLWPVLLIITSIFGSGAVLFGLLLSIVYITAEVTIVNPGSLLHINNLQILAVTLLVSFLAYLLARRQSILLQNTKTAKDLSGELSNAKDKEHLMLDNIADAVVGVDTIGHVVLFNRAAEQITNWDAHSAGGIYYNNIFNLKDGHDKEIVTDTDPFLQAMKTGQYTRTNEFYMLNKNNEKISFSISIVPTYDKNHLNNGAVGVFHDISEQKAVQRERNEFVSTASHEMRTPVAAIEGFLSMATNPNLATIDERARAFINKAHDSSLHLGRLFQDLLSVTKIEDKHLNDQRNIFNLNDLIAQIVSEMDMIAQKKKLKLIVHYGQPYAGTGKVLAPIIQIEADQERLREVISNLIDNAIKYTMAGEVEVNVSSHDGIAIVSIRDTGLGISLEDQKHLFEKFYRANNSMTREIGGTGLGLFIARQLIEHYGGRIWVESQVGHGSTFSFSLPIKKTT